PPDSRGRPPCGLGPDRRATRLLPLPPPLDAARSADRPAEDFALAAPFLAAAAAPATATPTGPAAVPATTAPPPPPAPAALAAAAPPPLPAPAAPRAGPLPPEAGPLPTRRPPSASPDAWRPPRPCRTMRAAGLCRPIIATWWACWAPRSG